MKKLEDYLYYHEPGPPDLNIYHGDCLEIMPLLQKVDVVVTDPPYGINYSTGQGVSFRNGAIHGDKDTTTRDAVLHLIGEKPALMFGTWKRPRPKNMKMLLIWDTLGALGMGDLSIPWKPAHQEIYVIGSGFHGHRGTDVLSIPPVQSMAKNGRVHPMEKPKRLMKELIIKCPDGEILDPFLGSGTTLVACKELGRNGIGIEINEKYCEIAKKRLINTQRMML